jgi:ligand-binding SRPBCC domain-containing protein
MPVYERECRVGASLDRVVEFHSRVDGLVALTPGFVHLEIERVTGPDGESNPAVLEAGSTIEMRVEPFGVLPRQSWRSVIRERVTEPGSAYFVDEMVDGPFREWRHTHSFFADGDATIVRDRIEYRLPFGGLGGVIAPLAKVGFEPMFRYRHRRTRELLE